MPPRRSTRIAQPTTSTPAASTSTDVVADVAQAVVDDAPKKAAKAKATKAPATKATKTAASRKRTVDEESDEELVKKPSKKRAKVTKMDIDDADDTKDANGTNDVDDAKDAKDDAKDDDDVDMDDKTDDKKDDKKDAKMVEVLKRGAAPVDPTSNRVHSHQVYDSGSEIWDAMLNQTNIGNNNNKFYVIQILHPIGNNNACSVFTRWGRVGERGQNKAWLVGSPQAAISEFKKIFRNKSGEAWENRQNMTARTGKYLWVERSFEEPKSVSKSADNEPIPDSKLEPDVQAFCRMVFSSDLMSAALSSMNYDARKLPLGNLSKSTILKGFAALNDLATVLDNPNGPLAKQLGGLKRACENLSNQYYCIIPHDCGRNVPGSIDTKPKLKKELELVEALRDMEIAQKMIDDGETKDANGISINPIDGHFQSLDLKSMDPIQSTSDEFTRLQEYVSSTHGHTHSSYRSKISHAFRVERHDEGQRWSDSGYDKLADGERLLLWHGSRSTNFAGILKQGLRIAPPEAPVTGYMFGKGVYFADAMSKSANYCHAYSSNNVGILLLCEVAAKPFYEQVHANYNAAVDCGQARKLATKGLGRTQPADWQDAGETLGHDDLKGCWMPKGGLATNAANNVYLQYNEYIVYDPAQIKLRYLLMVDMK